MHKQYLKSLSGQVFQTSRRFVHTSQMGAIWLVSTNLYATYKQLHPQHSCIIPSDCSWEKNTSQQSLNTNKARMQAQVEYLYMYICHRHCYERQINSEVERIYVGASSKKGSQVCSMKICFDGNRQYMICTIPCQNFN